MRKGDRLRIGAALVEVLGIGKEAWEPAAYSYKGDYLLDVVGVFCRVVEAGEIVQSKDSNFEPRRTTNNQADRQWDGTKKISVARRTAPKTFSGRTFWIDPWTRGEAPPSTGARSGSQIDILIRSELSKKY